jgi:hypothetical protein
VHSVPSTDRERRFRKVATDFWFAVQRMGRRGQAPPPTQPEPGRPDDPDRGRPTDSQVPRLPPDSFGAAGAEAEPDPTES